MRGSCTTSASAPTSATWCTSWRCSIRRRSTCCSRGPAISPRSRHRRQRPRCRRDGRRLLVRRATAAAAGGAARPRRPLPRAALRAAAVGAGPDGGDDPRLHPPALPAVPAQPGRLGLRAHDDPAGRPQGRPHPDRVGGVEARHPPLHRCPAREDRRDPQRPRRPLRDRARRRGARAGPAALRSVASVRALRGQHQAAQEPRAADRGVRAGPRRRARRSAAGDDRRRDLEVPRRCGSRCTVTGWTSTCASSASSRRRRWWRSIAWPASSSSRRSTRASACRRSRRWPT